MRVVERERERESLVGVYKFPQFLFRLSRTDFPHVVRCLLLDQSRSVPLVHALVPRRLELPLVLACRKGASPFSQKHEKSLPDRHDGVPREKRRKLCSSGVYAYTYVHKGALVFFYFPVQTRIRFRALHILQHSDISERERERERETQAWLARVLLAGVFAADEHSALGRDLSQFPVHRLSPKCKAPSFRSESALSFWTISQRGAAQGRRSKGLFPNSRARVRERQSSRGTWNSQRISEPISEEAFDLVRKSATFPKFSQEECDTGFGPSNSSTREFERRSFSSNGGSFHSV